jgi:hypothetical protein
MFDKLKGSVKSRRFWVAVSSVCVVLMQDVLGIDPETATKIVGVGIAWIVGDSLRETE